MIDFETSKTLQQLEGNEWGEPDCDSYLVTTCHRLRKKPVGEFTDEDLRIMIGQNIGLDFLIPMALCHLEDHLLAGGVMYEGCLLNVVINADLAWWADHSELWCRVDMLVDRFAGLAKLYEHDIAPAAQRLKCRLFGVVEQPRASD